MNYKVNNIQFPDQEEKDDTLRSDLETLLSKHKLGGIVFLGIQELDNLRVKMLSVTCGSMSKEKLKLCEEIHHNNVVSALALDILTEGFEGKEHNHD